MLEASKDRVFVGPAIGLIHNTLHEARSYGISYESTCAMGLAKVMESSQRTMSKSASEESARSWWRLRALPGRRRGNQLALKLSHGFLGFAK